jgi:hypothetical protein
MSCGGNPNQLMGGRRRRTGRKQRGGMGYEFGGALDGTNLPKWGGVENMAATPGGTLIPNGGELQATQLGGRRRRRTGKKRMTRRGGRKSRRVMPRRKRTMRGGASWYSPSVAGGAFVGNGSAGLPNLTGYSVNTVAGGPVENFDGAMRTSS